MDLKIAPREDGHDLFLRRIWPEANVEIGKYRVMYGYRLRSGYIDEDFVELDICCGRDRNAYNEMQNIVLTIMNYNGPENPYKDMPPYSRVKPYWNDAEFVHEMKRLYNVALAAGYDKVEIQEDPAREVVETAESDMDVINTFINKENKGAQ